MLFLPNYHPPFSGNNYVCREESDESVKVGKFGVTSLQAASWTLGVVGRPKFTSLTIKYSASAISIAAPSVDANIFMTPLSFSV